MRGCKVSNCGQYYNEQFRKDINAFVSGLPEESRHHSCFDDSVTIQLYTLEPHYDYINTINQENRIKFAIALFFNVLVDQVCYTYFQSSHQQFQELTKYPKLRGNCCQACWHNMHPSLIFPYLFQRHSQNLVYALSEDIEFCIEMQEATTYMEKEVHDFFSKYLPGINNERFWEYCLNEIPIPIEQLNIDEEKHLSMQSG